jgi:hypothetical protein
MRIGRQQNEPKEWCQLLMGKNGVRAYYRHGEDLTKIGTIGTVQRIFVTQYNPP